MENAVEALRMAGMVLIFIVTLSVSVTAFSNVRQTADIILNYKDREMEYIDGNLYYETTGTEREVGLETIIPTLSRAYNERYKVIFTEKNGKNPDGSYQHLKPIYTKKANAGKKAEDRYGLELDYDKSVVQSGSTNNKVFFDAVVYGEYNELDPNDDFRRLYIDTKAIEFDKANCVYNQLTNANIEKIKEYSGAYYQEDIDKTQGTPVPGVINEPEVPDVNKTRVRVIIYEIEYKS